MRSRTRSRIGVQSGCPLQRALTARPMSIEASLSIEASIMLSVVVFVRVILTRIGSSGLGGPIGTWCVRCRFVADRCAGSD